ncbi:MAG: tRNA (cytidine(34)-2'-O)-methyltransferase [Simkaniaceae bacterium]
MKKSPFLNAPQPTTSDKSIRTSEKEVLKIILFQPQIPANTGNIVRTAHVTGASLSLVRPLGFSVSNRHLKRAGLDYWEGVDVTFIDDLFEYLKRTNRRPIFFSSQASQSYTEIQYQTDDMLIFGSETEGLPSIFKENWPENFVTLPMKKGARCLNLSNSVAIALYEAWRQIEFKPMSQNS